MPSFIETAHHEAGHIVVLEHLRYAIPGVSFSSPSASSFGGKVCQVEMRSDEDSVMVAMAGPIASTLFLIHEKLKQMREDASFLALDPTQIQALFTVLSRPTVSDQIENPTLIPFGHGRGYTAPNGLPSGSWNRSCEIFLGDWKQDIDTANGKKEHTQELFAATAGIVGENWSKILCISQAFIAEEETVQGIAGSSFGVCYSWRNGGKACNKQI